MKLRDYQKKATQIGLYDEKEIILELATGSGKSVIISELAKTLSKNSSVVVLTNISSLIIQLESHLNEFGITPNIIKANMHKKTDSNVFLIMEQSFYKKKRDEFGKFHDCVLIKDEVHVGYNGKRFKEIVEHIKPKKIIGLSATPYNEDGTILKKDIYPYSILSLKKGIEQNWLVPIRWFIPKIVKDIDYSNVRMSGLDYNTNDLFSAMDTPEFYNGFSKFLEKINLNNEQTAIFCSNIEQANKIAEITKKINEKTAIIHSKIKDEINNKNIELFKNGNITTIVSVSKISIGFDAPNITQIVNLRATKILRLFVQIVGRGVRKHNSKNHCKVYDFGNCIEEFGFIDSYDYIPQETKEQYKSIMKEMKEPLGEIVEFKEDEIIEVSKEKIKIYLNEINEQKKIAINSNNINDLIKAFNVSDNIYDILTFGAKISSLVNARIENRTVLWIFNKWEKMIKDIPIKEKYFTKVLKTRTKNIIKENKKFASLYYFADFIEQQLKENEPWLFNSQETYIMEDDEIPF